MGPLVCMGHLCAATTLAQLSDGDGSATADPHSFGAGDLGGERHNVPLPFPEWHGCGTGEHGHSVHHGSGLVLILRNAT